MSQMRSRTNKSPSIDSIEKTLSETRIDNASIYSIPFDVWREICSLLDTRTICRLEATSRHLYRLITIKNGNYIFKDQCRKEGLPSLSKEKFPKERVVNYLKIKSLWMLGNYHSSREYQQDQEGIRGISYLSCESCFPPSNDPRQRSTDRDDGHLIYSSSWNGLLSCWKLGISSEECENQRKSLDKYLFDAWFTPPPTPQSPSEEYHEYMSNSPPTSVQKIEKICDVIDFSRPIKTTARNHDSWLLGFGSPPYLILLTKKNNQYKEQILVAPSPMSCLALSNDFCVGASLNVIYYWPLNNSKMADPFSLTVSRESIKFISFLQMPSIILFMCLNGDVLIFDLTTHQTLLHFISTSGLSCGSMIQLDLQTWKIMGGYRDGNIRSWIISKSNSQNNAFSVSNLHLLCSLGDHITCILVYETLIISGSWDGRIRIFDSQTHTIRRTLSDKHHHSPILCLTFQNEIILSGHYDGSITAWSFFSEKDRKNRLNNPKKRLKT